MTDWFTLIDSLYDFDWTHPHPIPGQNWMEWIVLSQSDYDDVDRMLLDYETIGA